MRILEARFHPDSKSGPSSIPVGRVFCDGPVARIQPLRIRPEMVAPFETPALFDRLEALVGAAVGDTFHALVRLESGSWSFVEVQARGADRLVAT
jgi:hypothetical protein